MHICMCCACTTSAEADIVCDIIELRNGASTPTTRPLFLRPRLKTKPVKQEISKSCLVLIFQEIIEILIHMTSFYTYVNVET